MTDEIHIPVKTMTPQDDVVFYLHPHPRSPFSEAVKVSNVLYLSAMIGLKDDGKLAESFDEQTHQIMINSAEILGRYGLGLEHIFKATVMLTDMSQWGAFNKIYRTYFHPSRLPVRTAFGVSGLAYEASVEVEFAAYIPETNTLA
jgi:2-iminobutanoate/2-iminopropanoate deaminase